MFGALYNDFEGKVYSVSLKGDEIILSHGVYNFRDKHKITKNK